jgi:hypothetical protein
VRRIAPILVLSVAMAVGAASTATPESLIAIRGLASGAHLQLSLSASDLVVSGPLEGVSEDCRFSRARGAAACPLTGVGAIEVDMGPANDKVEVLDPLPVPLTAYLGDGSDKLIGNDEPDTCYTQGSNRNRCIGEGGDDVCISGPVNTDCVGGAGNDYCKTGSGSDGCWGEPGRDVCMMGAGEDGCHGGGGDDLLYGGAGSDQLYGGPGFDHCDGGPGAGQSHECEAGRGQ